MKHVLFSYHTCPMEEPGEGLAGGMNVFLRGLLPGLGRRGIETDVLTRGRGNRSVTTRPFPGVRVIHVPCGWRDPPTREDALASLPRFAANAGRLLRGAGGPYDVASAHYWMSGVAARAILGEGIPLVVSFHTVEARKPRPAGWRPDALFLARTAAEAALAREADAVVCFSRHDLSATRKVLPVPAGKGSVIPPGVGEPFRRPPSRDAARRALGIPARPFLFLLAARPDPGKNLADAVAAFGALRAGLGDRVRLLVAGQRPAAGPRARGVSYAGPVPHAGMPRLFAAADAVLCPSLYESFGLVPLEAMAAGVPVVAPSSGYWGGVVRRRGGGLSYSPGDAQALRDAMRALVLDPALGRRLADEAGRVAAAFTWETCTASWARLLRRASRRGSRRGAPRAPAAPRRRGAGRRGAS